ncbi:hypothetical protein SEPCBS57363_001798 [Sporothrix epigloea]|uniref:Velvet domain-containing protein n=1 Tax=Sporothrix epigloea TaxID=1892477 RepID=A0ABP0DCB5_9PEZI
MQSGGHTIAPAPIIEAEGNVPDYVLEMCQQPQHARVALGKEKADRKPIDPPPILQLKVSHKRDPWQNFLQSPYYFVTCSLLKGDETPEKNPLPNHLIGTVVSSLHRLKDSSDRDGAFFVFGDVGCRTEGKYRLRFTLYQMQKLECVQLTSTVSDAFQVYLPRFFPGLAQSTYMTRSFNDQGVRLRLRKESWGLPTRKRTATAAEISGQQQGYPDLWRLSQLRHTVDTSTCSSIAAGTTDSNTYDPHTHTASSSYGHFSLNTGKIFTKRRRVAIDHVRPPPPAYNTFDGLPAGTADFTGYGPPQATTHQNIAMPTGLPSYDYSEQIIPSSLGYSQIAETYAHQQLNRLKTEQPSNQHGEAGKTARGDVIRPPLSPYPPQPTTQYSMLQSPPPFMDLQPSTASSTGGHFQMDSSPGDYSLNPSPLYVSNMPADANSRSRVTLSQKLKSNDTSTSMSQPGLVASYTPATATGSMAPYAQSLCHYSYVQALGDPESHLLATAPGMYAARAPTGLSSLDLHHNNESDLCLDQGQGDPSRRNLGRTSCAD